MPATASQIHPAHAANMTAKAVRLVTFLRQHGAGLDDPGVVAWLTDEQWAEVAAMAGERVPSTATRAVVVTLLGSVLHAAADEPEEVEVDRDEHGPHCAPNCWHVIDGQYEDWAIADEEMGR